MIKVDGSPNPFTTKQVQSSDVLLFNTSARLILDIADLKSAHMFINLCTFTDDGTRVTSVAVSKVGLKSFPVGRPRKFSIPLLSTENTAIHAASLTLTSTISAFIPNYSAMRNQQAVPPRPTQSQFGPQMMGSAPSPFTNYNSYPM